MFDNSPGRYPVADNTQPSPPTIPAGWYPPSHDPEKLAYWNGQEWSDSYRRQATGSLWLGIFGLPLFFFPVMSLLAVILGQKSLAYTKRAGLPNVPGAVAGLVFGLVGLVLAALLVILLGNPGGGFDELR